MYNFAFILLFIVSACSTTRSKQSDGSRSSLEGAWKIQQMAFRFPDSNWTYRTPPYESLYIFSKGHYSYSYVLGPNPRKMFAGDANKPTEVEKVSAYDTFVSNAGTYTLNDSLLILRSILHKNPNEMKSQPLAYKIVALNNKIEITISNPPFLPGREWKTILTRVE